MVNSAEEECRLPGLQVYCNVDVASPELWEPFVHCFVSSAHKSVWHTVDAQHIFVGFICGMIH